MAADQAAQLRLLVQQTPQPETKAKWLVMTSSRTGCGVTTLTAQLALVLHRRGVRLALVDAAFQPEDSQGGNLTEWWGKTGRPGLAEWLNGGYLLDELWVDVADDLRFLPRGNPASWRNGGEMLNQNLVKLVDAWRQNDRPPDAVMVDLGVAQPQWHEPLWRRVRECILVAVPDRDVLLDTYALIKRMPDQSEAAIRLIINRAADAQQVQSIFQGLVQVCRRFLNRHVGCDGWLPDDPSLDGHRADTPTSAGPFGRAMECLAVQWLNRLQARKTTTQSGAMA